MIIKDLTKLVNLLATYISSLITYFLEPLHTIPYLLFHEYCSQTMEKILKEVTFITDRMLGDDEDEQCALEWRFTAAVLDK